MKQWTGSVCFELGLLLKDLQDLSLKVQNNPDMSFNQNILFHC